MKIDIKLKLGVNKSIKKKKFMIFTLKIIYIKI